jgi:hypothetical protein
MRTGCRTRAKRRLRTLAGVAVFVIVASAALPTSAGAEVKIYDTENLALLGTIAKAHCKVIKRPNGADLGFLAFSLPDKAPFSLFVFIQEESWHGFRGDYPLLHGGTGVGFRLTGPPEGDGELYSNVFGIPGTPPGTVSGGAIRFSKDGRRLSIGFAPAANSDFTQGVVFAGAMKCRYRAKRKP